MKIKAFFLTKTVIFIAQIFIISLLIISFNYDIKLSLDLGISETQERIIQFLANYVLFDDLHSLIFIYLIWLTTSLIPIFLFNDIKRAYSMNITTYFFPNFFVYTFLYRYSRNYFDINFVFHILHTILLGLTIILISIFLSLFLKKMRKIKPKTHLEDLQIVFKNIKSKCTNCGAEFDSSPIYCYNCNTKLIFNQEENARLK